MTSLQKKILIFSSIVAAGTLAWTLVLLLPLQHKLQQEHLAVYNERIKNEVAKTQLKNLETTQREYKRLSSTTEQLQHFFVSKTNVLSFISSLEASAAKTHVSQKIDNLQEPSGTTKNSTFQLHVSGTSLDVLSYISEIERSEYYLSISQIRMTRSEGASSVNLSLQVTVQWL
ncbi:MAG: hypothetical protein V1778_03475 [bacterium]